uniref:Uncharacterized protein n=1 Tax=Anguilla anguilla TaxID=7936 RepID=A0A0E9X5N1_ANGAN
MILKMTMKGPSGPLLFRMFFFFSTDCLCCSTLILKLAHLYRPEAQTPVQTASTVAHLALRPTHLDERHYETQLHYWRLKKVLVTSFSCPSG